MFLDFITRLLNKLGTGIQKLLKGAEKFYDHLEKPLQEAQKDAATFVDIINKNPDATVEFLFNEIKKVSPHFDSDEKIEAVLQEVWKDFRIGDTSTGNTGEQILLALQAYLKSLEGSKWAKQSEFISSTIALFIAPGGTIWNKIGSVMWVVYQRFIKK